MDLKRVLTIAGSDSSGGAGIQADLKTIAAHLLYGESVLTALTAQNTCGVAGVLDVPPEFVAAQIDAVFEDIRPDAVKVGMVSSAANARAVAAALARHAAENVVVDPVMVATSGGSLMRGDAFDALVGELLPLADLVTPNIPEAQVLAGLDEAPADVASMVGAAHAIARLTPGAVLVKGGHMGGDTSIDVLLPPGAGDPVVIEGPRVVTANTHGTGCTLSSAIACNLACGMPLEVAVRTAKEYLADCLAAGLDLGRGGGPLDHMARLRASSVGLGPADAPWGTGFGAGREGVASLDTASEPAVAGKVRVLVVGGSPERPRPDVLSALALQADVVVACDSGGDVCRGAGVRVDVLVGDEDSIGERGLSYARSCGAEELTYPVDKDDTDLGLALGWVRERYGSRVRVVLTGVSGGRPDHALAVLGLLARSVDLEPSVEENGLSMRILGEGGATSWTFSPSDVGRTASVVALLGRAVVNERGMRWEVDRAPLDELDDLGVSNIVERPGASVEVCGGTAAVVLMRERVVKQVHGGEAGQTR